MKIDSQLVENVVSEVLRRLGEAPPVASTLAPALGRDGLFSSVNDAVTAAAEAQKKFAAKTLEDRKKAVDCIRRVLRDQAREFARIELEETKIGRLDHKLEKLYIVADRTRGVEALASEVWSGDHGLTVVEHAPWGVIGIVTPVTHSIPTVGSNAIQILAAGNSLVCNPHPTGAKSACYAAQLFNRAIREAIGIDNLICLIEKPTIESANEIFFHPAIRFLLITGGPAVVRAAMKAPKRVVCAGPGNPPVVVDETADIDRAARCIITGASFDNNLLCFAEKEVFAVDAIYDKLKAAMIRHGAYELKPDQIAALAKAAFVTESNGHRVVNKSLVGKSPQVLADQIGVKLPPNVELLFGDCPGTCPFVEHEQMMPFIPFVRCRDVDEAIALALKAEGGNGHTAVIHSKNVDNMTKMGKTLNTTLFIKNGPSTAGVGIGGEGTNSFSIATPTGDGPTSPLTFTRVRRCVMVDNLRIV